MSGDEEVFRRLGCHLRGLFEGLGIGGCRPPPGLGEHPFPPAGIDGYLGVFVLTVRFDAGPLEGKAISLTLPNAAQTVARSQPFIYRGPPTVVEVPLPEGSTLSPTIREQDFQQRPPQVFQVGKESVWLQILNLDARQDTPIGPVRIILGETLKREYPDLFMPSLGVIQSYGRSGFPARLAFEPTAILETRAGSFRAVHSLLAYARIDRFPPVGSSVQAAEVIPLYAVEDLRRSARTRTVAAPSASVLGLSHTITTILNVSGQEAFDLVEQGTAQG